MEDELRRLGRDVLVPINKEAGCVDVYFLEPNTDDNNPNFGVVSIWANKETLINMKKSEKYIALLQSLAPFTESFTDSLYIYK
jgi:quinol monooxygenase YgiN